MEGIDNPLDTIRNKIKKPTIPLMCIIWTKTAYFITFRRIRLLRNDKLKDRRKTKLVLQLHSLAMRTELIDSSIHLLVMLENHDVFKRKLKRNLGLFYLYNSKLWMAGPFFESFLRRFSIHVKRKVLPIDNAPLVIYGMHRSSRISKSFHCHQTRRRNFNQ